MMDQVMIEENEALRKELVRVNQLLQESRKYDDRIALMHIKAENLMLKSVIDNKNKKINDLYEQINGVYDSLVKTIEMVKELKYV